MVMRLALDSYVDTCPIFARAAVCGSPIGQATAAVDRAMMGEVWILERSVTARGVSTEVESEAVSSPSFQGRG